MGNKTGELDLKFFIDNGFEKKVCTKCGSYFWTTDPERTTCGDTPCDEYTFIKNSPVPKEYDLRQMRSFFINFFQERGHKFLKPYPVVPRWREDVLLVNASIYDFQPHVTSGIVKPPGNPIVMSQPSIRMTDIDLVGITGRHLTSFEMLCHDAFNSKHENVYWKDEAVSYCYSFLSDGLKIEGKLISFKEKPWSGGGNAGNALEVFINGLEVATLVFMDMKEDPNGSVEIEGIKYSKMDMRIVDTGYGLERLVWLSQGTPTVYQAIYPEIIQKIMENSDVKDFDEDFLIDVVRTSVMFEPYDEKRAISILKNKYPDAEKKFEAIKSIRNVFVIADHTRSLMHMFQSYVIPSNVRVGYLARLLIRHAIRYSEDINLKIGLNDLIMMNYESLKDIIEEFPAEFSKKMIEIETEKYNDLISHGKDVLNRMIKAKGKLSVDDLIVLYDSHGMNPETVLSLLGDQGISVDIPSNFHSMVIRRHEKAEASKKKENVYPDIQTRPLYYDDSSMGEFTGIVMYSKNNEIILDKTAFYPEGGGQPCDLGYFMYRGSKVYVRDVQKYGNAIVHRVDSDIPAGIRVAGYVDMERRRRLMVHHTSTHLLLGVLREILGMHVWQNSVQKDVDESRLDITHYSRIDEETAREIERRCFELITEGRDVHVKNMDWYKAINTYGFRLFEGGVPLTPKVRVVQIDGVDAEGCGGTHLKNISSIGVLKIKKIESVQENIYRITFSAGEPALELFQDSYSELSAISERLKKKPGEIKDYIEEMQKENIRMKRENEEDRIRLIERSIDQAPLLSDEKYRVALISADSREIASISRLANRAKINVIVERIEGKSYKYAIISGTGDALNIASEVIRKNGSGNERYCEFEDDGSIHEKLINSISSNRKDNGK
ncbi:MAG: alanine--tRNA ligase [Thermoplasmata archaeon]